MPPKPKAPVPVEAELKKNGLSLYDFQREGIQKMTQSFRAGLGCINADEMGLGKTCQTTVALLKCFNDGAGPFLVIAPLSVAEHWETEVNRFGCGKLKPIKYVGYKDELTEITVNFSKASVFIVPNHTFADHLTHRRLLKAMGALKFSIVVIDEAQSIKNPRVQMAQLLKKHYNGAIHFLLTGTPIQNNLSELYSLLCYCDRKSFPETGLEAFLDRYNNAAKLGEVAQLLRTYMIRRTKKEVFPKWSELDEVVLYHDMAPLQQTMYKAIISKNAEMFKHTKTKSNMVSVMIELRKITNHPYLIQGVEPEPLEEGEHMVEVSGKLQILVRLLCYLKDKGHRCLIFSFFRISLDIVQDYLEWRGFSAVRIDGTVRSSDRVERIQAFQEGKGRKIEDGDPDEPWIFMATTGTGGVGLNLTAADTVIFLDSDWNPQNDIQAMARCHRIGQEKAVRIIRLVARFTVEQYMLVHAREKLKLSDAVMVSEESKAASAVDIKAAIRAGLAEFMEQKASKTFTCTDAELEKVIGATDKKGEWLPLTKEQKDVFLDIDDGEKDVDRNDHRTFQGVNYRISDRDEEAFTQLLQVQEIPTKRRTNRVDYADPNRRKKSLACRIEKTAGVIDDAEKEEVLTEEIEGLAVQPKSE